MLRCTPASLSITLMPACLCAVGSLVAVPATWAQGTLADYERAQGLEAKARDLVVNAPGPITWIGDADRFLFWPGQVGQVAGGKLTH